MQTKVQPRPDDYETRRVKIQDFSDAQLKDYFWELCEQLVEPLLDLSRKNTSPSVERAVLLRMGFSSLEVAPIVNQAIDHGLIKYGVGHCVYVVSKHTKLTIRKAGLELMEGKHWDKVEAWIKEGK